MALQSSRGRRSRRSSTSGSTSATNVADGTAIPSEEKAVSHRSHHRMIAQATNALIENFGELRNQVVETEREYKRADKDLDAGFFQIRKQLEAVEKRLTDFVEEMTQVAFESNLKIRGNSDRLSALWDALQANSPNVDDVKQRREEAEARELARQAEIDRRLGELATQKEEKKAPAKAKARRTATRKPKRKGA